MSHVSIGLWHLFKAMWQLFVCKDTKNKLQKRRMQHPIFERLMFGTFDIHPIFDVFWSLGFLFVGEHRVENHGVHKELRSTFSKRHPRCPENVGTRSLSKVISTSSSTVTILVVERHTVKFLQLKLGCGGSFHLEDFLLELVNRCRIVPGVKSRCEIRWNLLAHINLEKNWYHISWRVNLPQEGELQLVQISPGFKKFNPKIPCAYPAHLQLISFELLVLVIPRETIPSINPPNPMDFFPRECRSCKFDPNDMPFKKIPKDFETKGICRKMLEKNGAIRNPDH